MDKQTIFLIIGIIVLLVVVIDGIRRMRNASPRYQQRLYEKNKVEIDDLSSAELPNGGHRIVKDASEDNESMTHITDIDELEQNLDEHVPVLMDSVEQTSDTSAHEDVQGDTDRQTSFDLQQAPIDEDDVLLQSSQHIKDKEKQVSDSDIEAKYRAVEAESGFSAIEDDLVINDALNDFTDHDLDQEKKAPTQDVLVLNVTSNDESFLGLELYHAMIASGLRFGDMDIFHSTNQQGQTQFSLVNSVQPGTFDLESINQFSTPGVSLFMQLPCSVDAITAFEQMKNVAQFLAKELNGQVRDDEQNRLTEQTTEHYRDRIRRFQRAQLLEQV